jgi:hypothetical protein
LGVSQSNNKSRKITREKGYGDNNIYVRGLMFKKELKNQIEKGKEEKMKKEL